MFDEGCNLRIRFLGIGKGAKAEAKLKTKKRDQVSAQHGKIYLKAQIKLNSQV